VSDSQSSLCVYVCVCVCVWLAVWVSGWLADVLCCVSSECVMLILDSTLIIYIYVTVFFGCIITRHKLCSQIDSRINGISKNKNAPKKYAQNKQAPKNYVRQETDDKTRQDLR
jgi:hypothetical protein